MSDDIQFLRTKLLKIFWILATIDLCVFIGIFFLHKAGISLKMEPQALWVTGVVLLILTAALSAAIPILIRSLFVSRTHKARKFNLLDYQNLQTTLIILPMLGALFAGLAYLFLVPKLHLYASILFGLYGVYSAIPDRKKIQGELNYFQKYRK